MLDCYFLIMKMQIISKLVKNDSQASTLSSSRNTLTNISNLLARPVLSHAESEYFPKRTVNAMPNRLKINKQVKLRDFFDNFQENCSTAYERVQHQTAPVKRSLTPLLESLASTPSITPFKDQYQMSFKKVSQNLSAFRNQTVQADLQHEETGRKDYYLQQGSKTKIKLRKFHSLMYIKAQQSQSSRFVHQIPTKRNLSLIKKQGSSLIRLLANKERLHTENAQETRPNSKPTPQPRLKSQAFEYEKQRLSKIRRQLNEIYQSKQEMRVRLY